MRPLPIASSRRRPMYRLRIFCGMAVLFPIFIGARIAYFEHGWLIAAPIALAGSWLVGVICTPRTPKRRGDSPRRRGDAEMKR